MKAQCFCGKDSSTLEDMLNDWLEEMAGQEGFQVLFMTQSALHLSAGIGITVTVLYKVL